MIFLFRAGTRGKLALALFPLFWIGRLCSQDGEGPAPSITLSGWERPGELLRCQPGPWGDLEYYYTYLEAPDLVIELINAPSQRTVWRFPGMTREKVKSLFEKAGISQDDQNRLLKHPSPSDPENEVRVFPDPEFVFHLSPLSRSTIYAVLRRWNENPFYRTPAIIETGSVKEWFSNSGLSEETISKIEKLTYPIGKSLAFSDVPLLLQDLTSDKEQRAILGSLTRTRTIILRLRLSGNSDPDVLKDYWTAGGRYRDTLPMLQSILGTGGLEKIDVSHLLPPTPRKFLYTFPTLSSGMDGTFPDSFSAALNFFEYTSKVWPAPAKHFEKYIQSNCDRVDPPFRFGDMILLKNSKSGRPIQACVYIADGIAYSKTGKSIMCPWIFAKLSNLVARYQGAEEVVIEGFRHKIQVGTD